MSTDEQPQVSLEVKSVKKKGQQKLRVSAYLGVDLLHVNSFDFDSDYSRAMFISRVLKKAQKHGIQVPREDLETMLLEAAQNMMFGLAPDGSTSEPDDVDSAEVLASFGLSVLGETNEQGILVWSEHTRKQSIIKSPATWRAEEVLQVVGSEVADRLGVGAGGAADEVYTLDQVRRAVALAGAQASRISSAKMIGQGVWPHGERLLIVDGAHAFFYDGSEFTRPRRPVIDKSILDLDAARLWHGSIIRTVNQVNADRTRGLLQRLCDLFSRWNWSHPRDPDVLAGLTPATIIQPLWEWRPWVAVTGPSDAGKSTLFGRLLQPIFLRWALLADRSTEAGLRQAIAHHAMPILIDEFDQYHHRQRVLELFRTSSRGGKVFRGTADQSGQQFALRHIPWFAAIESGDTWAQDSNRFIHFELLAPEGRELTLPSERELEELGRELAAAAIWAALSAAPLATAIKGTAIDGVPGRLVESFSVSAAMFAVLWHGHEATAEQAAGVLRRMIEGRQTVEVQREPEHERLIRDILATNIRVAVRVGVDNVMKDVSIGQLLREHSRYASDLEAKGLAVCVPRDATGQMLFIAPDAVRRHLLGGTRWRDSRIDQVLLRAPGARRCQQRCHGVRCRGVAIPLSLCLTDASGCDRGVTT